MKMRSLVLCPLLIGLGLSLAHSDGDGEHGEPLAGHSSHGEAFNDGPRQAAYLMKHTGVKDFPCSSKVDQVKSFVLQGVGQLHGFWWFEAERSFRQAAALDPACAIAYWGMAFANRSNPPRAKGFFSKASEHREKASPHEQAYIDALGAYLDASPADPKSRATAWLAALKKIIVDYPKDIEAKALFVVESWSNGRHIKLDREAVDKVIVEVLSVRPDHPVHHYKIHLWDGRTAARALESAAKCGQSATSVAHMWHMPGHIYSALHRYADAAWQQEASARTDHAYLIRDRVLPDQIFNYAHNNEWLVRNLMILGRVHDAMDLAQNMIQLPRHPRYNHFGRRNSSSSYGRRRLFEVLEYYEMWDELLEMTSGTYLEPTKDPTEQVRRHRARALAFVMKRRFSKAKAEVKLMQKKRPQVEQAMAKAIAEAEAKAKKDGLSGAEVKQKVKSARVRYERVLELVDSVAYELQCYLLVFANRPQQALDAMDKAKGMPRERRARFYVAAGKLKKAEKLIAEVVKSKPQRVQPLANQVDILYRIGNIKGARKAFAELRKHSAHIDRLDTPVFKRLASIARKLRLPRDWRIKKTIPKDVGARPKLDTLGPFRWTSYVAPKWTAPDANEKPISLDRFRQGKPVIVIFYLGDGCAHCVEQLKAFKPKTEKFKKLGVKIIAISTDPVPALLESMGPRGYPFTLVSNEKHDIFKKYRCYDDFEKAPLHGTFLIDSTGRVRWQDISFEPFTAVDFLIDETRRLLGQKLDPKPAKRRR